VAREMTGSVGPQSKRSSTYCSRVACGYCHSVKSWVRVSQKRWGLSLNPWGDSEVTCPDFLVGSSEAKIVSLLVCKGCKRRRPLSPGPSSK
jgi:hypothetical protein